MSLHPARNQNADAGPAGLRARPGGTVPVQVAELVVGRKLRYPIHDQQGVLLLAQGSVITEQFKAPLLARGIQHVLVNERDVGGVMAPSTPARAARAGCRIESEFTDKLDELIDSGNLFAADAGRQFRDRIVIHARTGYNRRQRDELAEQHVKTCSALDAMIKSASHQESVEARDIARVVTTYLSQLIADTDCVVSVVSQARRYMALAEHCLQMSLLGMALAIEMGMSEAEVCLVGLSGLLHDWGMTRVPEEIVNANRVLTRVEFLEIQKHPIYTLDLLRNISGIPSRVPLICFQVHEQPNGKGYPRGRQHENIHPAARVLRAADVYLALTAPRPFRPPLTPAAAMRCLLIHARNNVVDSAAVASLLNVMSLFPIGSYVLLSDDSVARVVRRNGDNYATPMVQIVQDAEGDQVACAGTDDRIIDPSEQGLAVVRGLPTPGRDEVELSPDFVNLKRV